MEGAEATRGRGHLRRILAFPFHDWRKLQVEGFRTRDAHLLEAFARRPDVEQILVVDRPTSLAERIARPSAASVAGSLRDEWRSGSVHASLTEVSPGTLVLDIATRDVLAALRRRRGWWFDVFARDDVAAAINEAVARTLDTVTDTVAWVPTVAPVLFDRNGRVRFDSLDNWLIHPTLRRHAADAEVAYATILPRADRVFASGPASARELARWRPDIAVVPNGVDPKQFAGPLARPLDLPAAPVVGYAGKLAERIDDDLVAAVAHALPDVQFVFVGPVLDAGAIRAMRKRRNVRILGDRSYSEIPAYLRSFDVVWIPHRVGEGETGGDPIKLYEYWAAGRQVVSTRIDGSEAWTAQAHLVDDAVQAAAAIRGLISGTRAHLPTAIPAGRTWDEIAGTILGDSAELP
jgi:glycosyltransferase involved in cell wall biosynthesis